jgi:hypothetical protein
MPHVDLVKLDLEGAELRALRGARRLLAERRPALLIELEPGHLERQGGSVAELESLLEGAGYVAFEIVPDGGRVCLTPLRKLWRRPEANPNIVLVPRERSAAVGAR